MAGRTALRGYGRHHKDLRKSWWPIVMAGGVGCARCGGLIAPGEAWDLDHTDDRRSYRGPSHSSCNRKAAHRRRFSRDW
jgi:hypothetical protein